MISPIVFQGPLVDDDGKASTWYQTWLGQLIQKLNQPLRVYANNAAAVAGGLNVGDFYRNGADPDIVCVVH